MDQEIPANRNAHDKPRERNDKIIERLEGGEQQALFASSIGHVCPPIAHRILPWLDLISEHMVAGQTSTRKVFGSARLASRGMPALGHKLQSRPKFGMSALP